MSFGVAISTCLRKYADFSGRASRSEFWYFILFIALVLTLGTVIAAAVSEPTPAGETPGAVVVLVVVWLALILPYWAAIVRRLHDNDRSGFFVFILLVPFVGGIILLAVLASRGTVGRNRFGPDPLADDRIPLPPGAPSTTRCPYCAELIQPEAVVCRWCGRDLSTRSTTTQGATGWLSPSSVFKPCPACGKPVHGREMRCPYCLTGLR